MKGIHRLSWVFGMLEKRYDIKYHLWSVGPATIVFAWGRKGMTKPTEVELPYEPVPTKLLPDDWAQQMTKDLPEPTRYVVTKERPR